MSEPLISIGIVTYNSAAWLPRVLDGILALEYPKRKIRPIFVDNHSTDNTLALLGQFREQHQGEFEQLLLIDRGRHDAEDIAEGRSLCVENAAGDFFLSLDSDALMGPQTLHRMLTHFQEHPDIGEVQFLAREPVYNSRMRNLLMNMYVTKESAKPYYGWTGGMHCVGIRMDLAKSLSFKKGFERGTDEDFHFRLRKQGYKILIDPVYRAQHLKPMDTTSGGVILRGYLKYLFWQLPRAHAPMILSRTAPRRQLARVAIYWALLMGLIILPFYPWLFLLCFLALALFEFVKSSGVYRLINPFLFPFFGIVYGLGMMRELFSRTIHSIRRHD